jgi:transposase
MIPKAREVRLKPKVRKVLEARCRAPTTAQRDVRRARIVLLAADGHSTRSIAEEVGVQPRIVRLAAALCRPRPWGTEGLSSGGQEADLRQGHE